MMVEFVGDELKVDNFRPFIKKEYDGPTSQSSQKSQTKKCPRAPKHARGLQEKPPVFGVWLIKCTFLQ